MVAADLLRLDTHPTPKHGFGAIAKNALVQLLAAAVGLLMQNSAVSIGNLSTGGNTQPIQPCFAVFALLLHGRAMATELLATAEGIVLIAAVGSLLHGARQNMNAATRLAQAMLQAGIVGEINLGDGIAKAFCGIAFNKGGFAASPKNYEQTGIGLAVCSGQIFKGDWLRELHMRGYIQNPPVGTMGGIAEGKDILGVSLYPFANLLPHLRQWL